jgi:hypothetical protein
MNIIGTIKSVGQVQNVPTKSGQTFTKRKLVLDASQYDRYTGQKTFENFPSFDFTGERVKLLDGYQPGQVVSVSFDIYGRYVEGSNDWFNSVVGYKIEPYQRGKAEPSAQPAGVPSEQPAAQQTAQPEFPPKVDDDGLPF